MRQTLTKRGVGSGKIARPKGGCAIPCRNRLFPIWGKRQRLAKADIDCGGFEQRGAI